MALTFDTQAVLPWNVSLTYTSVRATGNIAVLNLQGSKYAIKTGEVMASGGVYTASDAVFTFDKTDLAAVGSKPADTVTTEDGTVYTVLASPPADFLEFVEVTARNLVLAYDLRASAAVKRPANTQNAGGLRVPGLATVTGYEAVPCRVQEIGASVDVGGGFGGMANRKDFVIYVGQRLQLLPGDVLTVGGVDYDYAGSASWDRIDQLGEVKAYRVE